MKEYFVYLIRCGMTDCYKIGATIDIEKRMSELQTANPYELELVGKIITDKKTIDVLEKELHMAFENQRIRGEWFNFRGKNTDKVKEEFYYEAEKIQWHYSP